MTAVLKIKDDSKLPKDYTGVVESENGNLYWYKNGKFHREDGPAKFFIDGTKSW